MSLFALSFLGPMVSHPRLTWETRLASHGQRDAARQVALTPLGIPNGVARLPGLPVEERKWHEQV